MDPSGRDPYDAVVYHPPKPPVDPKIQAKWKQGSVFREEAPSGRTVASAPDRAAVPRDEVCIMDSRGGHRRIGLHCPHGVGFGQEHIETDEDAEYAAMHPTPPQIGENRAVSGTDFGRGTR